MAAVIELDAEVNLTELSRSFTTENPHTVGKIALTTEFVTRTPAENSYTYGNILLHFEEPEIKTVPVGLIPSFEPVEVTLLEDDKEVTDFIKFGLHLLLDPPI